MQGLADTYTAPVLGWKGDAALQEPVVVWIVFIGLAFFLINLYLFYCRAIGGTPDVDFTWRGIKITCTK